MEKIIVTNLSKQRKGFAVLDEISFGVHQGEILAIIGEPSSGKTLLTKLMGRIVLTKKGDARYDRRDTGMVISDQCLYPDNTVQGTLKYYAGLKKKHVSNAQVLNTLNLVGLKAMRKEYVDKLGPNQLTRLKIAVALVTRPGILILDDPFTGLSSSEAHHMRVLFKTLADGLGTAILLTARTLAEVEDICDRIALIDSGALVCIKSYNSLAREVEPYTKICVTTAVPNFTARSIETALGYETAICGEDVIVNAHPDNAQAIYDELRRQEIEVLGMTRVNKSIQEVFYNMVARKRGGSSVLA